MIATPLQRELHSEHLARSKRLFGEAPKAPPAPLPPPPTEPEKFRYTTPAEPTDLADAFAAGHAIIDAFFRANGKIPVELIQRRVGEHYGIKRDELLGPRRYVPFVQARQIAMFLAADITRRSLPEIGRRFGDRDHTTVIHATRKVSARMRADPEYCLEVVTLAESIIDGR